MEPINIITNKPKEYEGSLEGIAETYGYTLGQARDSYTFGETPEIKRYMKFNSFDELGFDPKRNNEALYYYNTSKAEQWYNAGAQLLHKTGDALGTKLNYAQQWKTTFGNTDRDYLEELIAKEEDLAERFPILKAPYETKGLAGYLPGAQGSLSKWTNFAPNLGFTLGTMVGVIAETAIISAATGGLGIGRLGLGVMEGVNAVRQYNRLQTLVKMATAAGSIKKAANLSKAASGAWKTAVASGTLGLIQNYSTASSEAIVEGAHAYSSTYIRLLADYEERNGPASDEKKEELKTKSMDAYTIAYRGNVLVLMASNLLQSHNALTIGRRLGQVGRATKIQGKINKSFKFSAKDIISKKNAFDILKTGMGKTGKFLAQNVLSEGLEESSQAIISQAAEDYIAARVGGKSVSWADAMGKGVDYALSDEGMEEFWAGALTGALMGGGGSMISNRDKMNYNNIRNIRKNYTKNKEQAGKDVVSLRDQIKEIHSLNLETGSTAQNARVQGVVASANKEDSENGVYSEFQFQNRKQNSLFSFVNDFIKRGALDDYIKSLEKTASLTKEEYIGIYGADALGNKTVKEKVSGLIQDIKETREVIDVFNEADVNPFNEEKQKDLHHQYELIQDLGKFALYSMHNTSKRLGSVKNEIDHESQTTPFYRIQEENVVVLDNVSFLRAFTNKETKVSVNKELKEQLKLEKESLKLAEAGDKRNSKEIKRYNAKIKKIEEALNVVNNKTFKDAISFLNIESPVVLSGKEDFKKKLEDYDLLTMQGTYFNELFNNIDEDKKTMITPYTRANAIVGEESVPVEGETEKESIIRKRNALFFEAIGGQSKSMLEQIQASLLYEGDVIAEKEEETKEEKKEETKEENKDEELTEVEVIEEVVEETIVNKETIAADELEKKKILSDIEKIQSKIDAKSENSNEEFDQNSDDDVIALEKVKKEKEDLLFVLNGKKVAKETEIENLEKELEILEELDITEEEITEITEIAEEEKLNKVESLAKKLKESETENTPESVKKLNADIAEALEMRKSIREKQQKLLDLLEEQKRLEDLEDAEITYGQFYYQKIAKFFKAVADLVKTKIKTFTTSPVETSDSKIDEAIEENTTEEEITEIAEEEDKTTDEVKAIIKDSIKKTIAGIKLEVSDRIKAIVKKILKALLLTSLLINTSFTQLNVYTPSVVKDTIEVVSEIQRDSSYERLTNDGKLAYDNEIKNNESFIIVDKPTATGYIYNSEGALIKDFPVLLGKVKGDGINTYNLDRSNEAGYITTAGRFELKDAGKNNNTDYDNKVLHLKGGRGVAIHKTYYNELVTRTAALNTETIDDNRMSAGCVNISLENWNTYLEGNITKGSMIIITRDYQDEAPLLIPSTEESAKEAPSQEKTPDPQGASLLLLGLSSLLKKRKENGENIDSDLSKGLTDVKKELKNLSSELQSISEEIKDVTKEYDEKIKAITSSIGLSDEWNKLSTLNLGNVVTAIGVKYKRGRSPDLEDYKFIEEKDGILIFQNKTNSAQRKEIKISSVKSVFPIYLIQPIAPEVFDNKDLEEDIEEGVNEDTGGTLGTMGNIDVYKNDPVVKEFGKVLAGLSKKLKQNEEKFSDKFEVVVQVITESDIPEKLASISGHLDYMRKSISTNKDKKRKVVLTIRDKNTKKPLTAVIEGTEVPLLLSLKDQTVFSKVKKDLESLDSETDAVVFSKDINLYSGIPIDENGEISTYFQEVIPGIEELEEAALQLTLTKTPTGKTINTYSLEIDEEVIPLRILSFKEEVDKNQIGKNTKADELRSNLTDLLRGYNNNKIEKTTPIELLSTIKLIINHSTKFDTKFAYGDKFGAITIQEGLSSEEHESIKFIINPNNGEMSFTFFGRDFEEDKVYKGEEALTALTAWMIDYKYIQLDKERFNENSFVSLLEFKNGKFSKTKNKLYREFISPYIYSWKNNETIMNTPYTDMNQEEVNKIADAQTKNPSAKVIKEKKKATPKAKKPAPKNPNSKEDEEKTTKIQESNSALESIILASLSKLTQTEVTDNTTKEAKKAELNKINEAEQKALNTLPRQDRINKAKKELQDIIQKSGKSTALQPIQNRIDALEGMSDYVEAKDKIKAKYQAQRDALNNQPQKEVEPAAKTRKPRATKTLNTLVKKNSKAEDNC